jgi:hypothetical protein
LKQHVNFNLIINILRYWNSNIPIRIKKKFRFWRNRVWRVIRKKCGNLGECFNGQLRILIGLELIWLFFRIEFTNDFIFLFYYKLISFDKDRDIFDTIFNNLCYKYQKIDSKNFVIKYQD